MRNSLLLALLFLHLSARSDCIAFLIPPTVRVTVDESGLDVWRKERTEHVVAYPAGKLLSHSDPLTEIEFDTFSPTFAACTARDFNISKKTGLMRLWTKKNQGFQAVWAKREGLVDVSVSYPPSSGSSGAGPRIREATANRAAAEHAAALVLDRVMSGSFKPPEIENQRSFAVDFDKTWAALVETLSDQKWQVESIDKGSGLITTKAAIDQRGATMACATKLDEAHKTWLNVFVKKVDTGTRVKVNATFHAIREDQVITCYSNGTLERALFDAIQKILGVH
jgi:hypothetical protein